MLYVPFEAKLSIDGAVAASYAGLLFFFSFALYAALTDGFLFFGAEFFAIFLTYYAELLNGRSERSEEPESAYLPVISYLIGTT